MHRITKVAWQAATPIIWAAIFVFWTVLSMAILVYELHHLFGFDTDPDPPGNESDPDDGSLLPYAMVSV